MKAPLTPLPSYSLRHLLKSAASHGAEQRLSIPCKSCCSKSSPRRKGTAGLASNVVRLPTSPDFAKLSVLVRAEDKDPITFPHVVSGAKLPI